MTIVSAAPSAAQPADPLLALLPPFSAPSEARWIGAFVEGLKPACSVRQDVELSPRVRGIVTIELPSVEGEELRRRVAKLSEAVSTPPGAPLDLDSPEVRCEPPRVTLMGGHLEDPAARLREMLVGTPDELAALVKLALEKRIAVSAARIWLASGGQQRIFALEVPDDAVATMEAALLAAGFEKRTASNWLRLGTALPRWQGGASWQGKRLSISAAFGAEDRSLPACQPHAP